MTIIEKGFNTIPNNQNKALEFYAIIDMALMEDAKSNTNSFFNKTGFYHFGLYGESGSPIGPRSYLYHKSGTVAVLKAFTKRERKESDNPVVRLIGNNERSVKKAKVCLEDFTKITLNEII